MNPRIYQLKPTGEIRKRKVFSVLPFLIFNFYTDIEKWIWTGKWFKWVIIEEMKVYKRYEKFDDGWTYQLYYTK